MRLLSFSFLLLALTTAVSMQAQPAALSEGRELPRSEWRVYPTAEEAHEAKTDNSRYVHLLTDWTWQGTTGEATFTVPFQWSNRQVLLRLEDVSSEYVVRVNGRRVGRCSNPQTSAEFNITKQVSEGRNTLQIEVAQPSKMAAMVSGSEQNTPRIGSARVMSQPTLYVRDVVTRTQCRAQSALAEIGLVIKSGALNPRSSRIHYELLDPEGRRLTGGIQDRTLRMKGEDTVRFLVELPDTLLWSVEHPVHCVLRMKTQYEGRYGEYIELPIGLREVEVVEGAMKINGQPVALRAAEVAADVPAARLSELRSKGVNLVIPKGGVPRSGFYTDCDTMGMMVVAVAPIDTHASGTSRRKGGNIANNPRWRAHFVERVEDSYHTTKLHPSVVAFMIARNSANGICLYEAYLAMKRYGDARPFIYWDGGGEWNSDRLTMERGAE